jgi:hypothetical protein
MSSKSTNLFQLLAVEEVTEEFLDAGDTGRATDEHNLVDLGLVNGSILQHLLDRVEGAVESLGVEILETGTGDLGIEILAIEERVDLDRGLGAVGQSSLGTLTGGPESSEGTSVAREI